MPEAVHEVVTAGVARLTPECLATLRAASVLGRRFGVDTLLAIRSEPREQTLRTLDEAVSAGVLTEAGGRCGFVRWPLADALYGELPLADRLRLHERAATALAMRVAPDEHVAEIAHHRLEAARLGGSAREAVASAWRAGDHAFAGLAFGEAEHFYARGLAHVPGGDVQARVELLLALARARARQGRVEHAREAYRQAAEGAGAVGDPKRLAEAAIGYGGEIGVPGPGHRDEVHGPLLEEALAAIGPRDSVPRVRLLVRLAASLFFTGSAERRTDLCRDALAMARRLGDEAAIGEALLGTHAATWSPDSLGERVAIGDELLALARRLGDRRLLARAHAARFSDLLERGDAGAASAELESLGRLAEVLGQPPLRGQALLFEATLATLSGRFEEAEGLVGRLAADGGWLGRAADVTVTALRAVLWMAQGRFEELIQPIRAAVALDPAIAGMRCGLVYVCAKSGREADAKAELQALSVEQIRALPRDTSFLPGVCQLGEACAVLGDAERCRAAYELALPYAGRSLVIGKRVAYLGCVAHYLGVMAASLGRAEEAIDHFERALESEMRVGARPWLASTQVAFAEALLATGDTGARDRARSLAGEALETAKALGMLRLAGTAEELVATREAAVRGAYRDDRPPFIGRSRELALGKNGAAGQIFRREGDFWTIVYASQQIRLRDARGLRYLATLLREPGREFHVRDLVAPPNGRAASDHDPSLEVVVGLGDTGACIDARARAAYRARLGELEEEIAEAERTNDLGRLERAAAEREALVAELAAAMRGLGNGSHTERARVAATKAIKAALERIAAAHPALGGHLQATVRRGTFCVYAPDPRYPVEWEA